MTGILFIWANSADGRVNSEIMFMKEELSHLKKVCLLISINTGIHFF